MSEQLYFIVDLRREWTDRPYISFWGPNCGGYYYPLPWSGRYTAAQIDKEGSYLTQRRYIDGKGHAGLWERFGVACEEVERLGVPPDQEGRGRVDGNTGPVVRNSGKMRTHLRRLRYVPAPASPLTPKNEG